MQLKQHPEFKITTHAIGHEKAPLVVIDNVMTGAEALVEYAAEQSYRPIMRAFPGVRAEAPMPYQNGLMALLSRLLPAYFNLDYRGLQLTMCHYSLVTTPPEQLGLIQRIPHVDAFEFEGVALVHYLFKQPLGGTAFYRHRKTGYEIITEERKLAYFASLEAENDGPHMPKAAYINGTTPLFEEIARMDGIFNRMLIYRRNSLHSGCIASDFVPDANPRTGRLSINSFVAPRQP